jgi:hypothetical protein
MDEMNPQVFPQINNHLVTHFGGKEDEKQN